MSQSTLIRSIKSISITRNLIGRRNWSRLKTRSIAVGSHSCESSDQGNFHDIIFQYPIETLEVELVTIYLSPCLVTSAFVFDLCRTAHRFDTKL